MRWGLQVSDTIPPMNRIYLVRHGENLANLTLEFSCRKVDYPLTPKGVLQAQQTAAFFRDKDIHEIYASPLLRARQTAEIIAEAAHLPVTVVEHFREVNVGELEGQKPTAALWNLHNRIIDDWRDGKPESCFPGGEDYHSLLGRMKSGLAEILAGDKSDRNIIIAGHGGIFTFALRDLCLDFDRELLKLPMHNCAITELDARVEGERMEVRLVSLGSTAHLYGEAADFTWKVRDFDEPAPE